jgi:Domain of unknown function (DUF1330)
MVRAFVLYEGDVDSERYQRHIEETVRPIPATFRHGKVFGTAGGEPQFRYYAEFEFADVNSFRQVSASPEFAAAAKDAAEMGISVHFVEIE